MNCPVVVFIDINIHNRSKLLVHVRTCSYAFVFSSFQASPQLLCFQMCHRFKS